MLTMTAAMMIKPMMDNVLRLSLFISYDSN